MDVRKEVLVPKATDSYIKLYNCVTYRGQWNDKLFAEIKARLDAMTVSIMLPKRNPLNFTNFTKQSECSSQPKVQTDLLELSLPFNRAQTTKSTKYYVDSYITYRAKCQMMKLSVEDKSRTLLKRNFRISTYSATNGKNSVLNRFCLEVSIGYLWISFS